MSNELPKIHPYDVYDIISENVPNMSCKVIGKIEIDGLVQDIILLNGQKYIETCSVAYKSTSFDNQPALISLAK